MQTLTPEQAAYWAGVIDGEGSVGVYRYTGRPKGGCTARIHIANTNRAWLEALHAELQAGKLTTPRINGPGGRAKLLSNLWFNRPEMEALIPQIRPYLRIKQRQADLVLRYFALTDAMKVLNFRRDDPQRIALVSERDATVAEVKALNQRGTGTPRAAQPEVAFRKCALTSCGLRHFCKGYCRRHYRRYVESGGPTWVERSCERCGKPFVAKTQQKVFCSKKCNHAAWMVTHRQEQVDARRKSRHAKRQQAAEPNIP